jgi:signal peptidase I
MPNILTSLGLSPQVLTISTTGSMYPTFSSISNSLPPFFPYPNGLNIFNHNFFSHTLGYGDIVAFHNQKTNQVSFVKRLIALPGDTIELRDGLVIRNGQVITEPYIAKARSTFGGDFLSDCTKLTIPPNKLFVLGDNRTGSKDSRFEVELVDIQDVNYVLPFKYQVNLYSHHWRDTTNDQSQNSAIHVDKNTYLTLLNKHRLSKLKYDSRLESNSPVSSYTTEATLTIIGHYTAEELVTNHLEFSAAKTLLTDSKYQSIGITEVPTQKNSCPSQDIIIRIAGYLPPNYSSDVVTSWSNLLDSQILLLSQLRSFPSQTPTLNEITLLVSKRINRLTKVVSKLKSNEWLTQEELAWTNEDKNLSQTQTELLRKLSN